VKRQNTALRSDPLVAAIDIVSQRAELLNRARDILPIISSNTGKTESERRCADDNIQAMQSAGLFKMLIPKRYGGLELDFRTHIEVTSVIGEACGASAWVLNLCNICSWMASLFPDKVKDDIYGDNPNALISGVLTPNAPGQSRRVEGGFIVSGKWYYSSGSLHADWGLIGVLETDDNNNPIGQHLALAPRSDFAIEDTWFTVGMRGSGSNCLVANEIFIPDYRMVSMPDLIEGNYSNEHTEEDLYNSAFIPAAALILVSPQLGMARAALQLTIDMSSKRAITYTSFAQQRDSTGFQIQLAKAAMKIETAHLHTYRAANDIDTFARSGQYMDYQTRARVRADAGVALKNVTDALQDLLFAHGAGSFAESSPMQRIWRDSNTAARHAVTLPAISEEVYGKALLGVENTVTVLV